MQKAVLQDSRSPAPGVAALLRSRRARLLLAFALIYVVWGSTYLAVRVGVSSMPPALFAGLRYGLAAVIMLVFARVRGMAFPSGRSTWGRIALTSFLLMVGGNGIVSWAEQWLESSETAMIAASSALWLAGLGTLGARGEPVPGGALLGLLLGIGGVALLVGTGVSGHHAPWFAYGGLLVSAVLWAGGSIYARRHPIDCSPSMAVALQLSMAGLALCGIGVASGELSRWSWSADAIGALVYLAVVSSCFAYAAYFWLVGQVRPALLGTHAYVNPAISVLLGYWLLGERLGPAQIGGALVILAGVALVTVCSQGPTSSEPRRAPIR